eukprot:3055928-Heterocapsa_arctica.AAC.1
MPVGIWLKTYSKCRHRTHRRISDAQVQQHSKEGCQRVPAPPRAASLPPFVRSDPPRDLSLPLYIESQYKPYRRRAC